MPHALTVLEAIDKRRSTKHFKPDAIAPTVLNALVDAAAEAASSFNLQPWRIVLIQSDEQKKALSAAAWNQAQITEAPVTFVFAVSISGWQQTFSQTLETAGAVGAWPEKTRAFFGDAVPKFQAGLGDKAREYAIKDAIIAATQVALAAESLGLGTCFMNGWAEDGVKKVIGAEGNDDIAIALVLPVGYASETPKHPGRLPRKSVVFTDRLDQPYTFKPATLRSPRETALGLIHLPRLIDKVRLGEAGLLPGYNYLTYGFDKLLLDLLSIPPEAFLAAVKSAGSDDQAIYAWVEQNGKKLTPTEKDEFNKQILAIGPSDPARAERFRRLLDSVDPARTELNTFVDLIDLSEGRI